MLSGTLSSTSRVASVCRSAWGLTLRISQRLETAASRISKLLGSRCVPALDGNSSPSGFGHVEFASVNRCRISSSHRPSEIAILRYDLLVFGVF